jgi:hypothetical protein
MANSYKDIVITPNKSSSNDDPKIVFSGADTTSNTDITLRMYPTSNGTLSFEGGAGQLFSISNTLTGTIFSVNDISGIPSIEVLDTGLIKLAPYNGTVSIGSANSSTSSTSNTSGSLVVAGGVGIRGNVYASTAVLTNTTPSISTTTGALVVAGGIGVSGTLSANSTLTFAAANPSITSSSYVVMPGGLFVSGGLFYSTGFINARAGLRNDSGTILTITGGTGGITSITGGVRANSTTSGTLTVAGDVGVNGDIYANNFFSLNYPTVLNDISTQFDGTKCVFELKNNQTNVVNIVDSKNVEVFVGGLKLAPYVKDLRYPWITPYDSYKGFRVVSSNTSSQVVIYNAPDIGEQASLTIINSSSIAQTKQYPYSADTIALGD